MNNNEGFFDFVNGEIKETQYCAECGKKLKSGLYFNGKGPYGACCYKKLFGCGVSRTKRVSIKKFKVSKNDIICPMGLIKECNSCVIREACDEFKD